MLRVDTGKVQGRLRVDSSRLRQVEEYTGKIEEGSKFSEQTTTGIKRGIK